MKERHNRKSYIPPQAVRESAALPKPPPKPAASKPSRTPHYTLNTGEIPLNIANDSHQRSLYPPSKPSPQPTRSTLSPSLSLEHLSLESKDEESRQSRLSSRSPRGDPLSAVDRPTRPFMGVRSVSSHNANSRTALQTTTLPVHTASYSNAPPPPTGAPPAPPISAGGPWHRQSNQMTGRMP